MSSFDHRNSFILASLMLWQMEMAAKGFIGLSAEGGIAETLRMHPASSRV
jgi:hypothetical protein